MATRRDLPFALINGAVSADGKLALENLSLIQFSSQRDRRLVFELRAGADAVLCGAETVERFSIDLAAGPAKFRLERKRKGLPAEPLRVLVSHDGDIDPHARIFRKPVSPLVILTAQKALRRCEARVRGQATVKAFGRSSVNYVAALRWLRAEYDVGRLVCEGGGETNAGLLQAGVIDEIHVTVCPLILRGGRAPTICDGDGVKSLEQSTRLALKAVRAIKGELFLTYRVLR